MASLEERLAALETRVRANEAAIGGGNGLPWSESLRGRVHAMQSAMASAELVRQAAEAASRAQREAQHTLEVSGHRRWSRLTQALLIACAIVTAAAPYVLHFAG